LGHWQVRTLTGEERSVPLTSSTADPEIDAVMRLWANCGDSGLPKKPNRETGARDLNRKSRQGYAVVAIGVVNGGHPVAARFDLPRLAGEVK
jgi:hypothetical protein